MNQVLPRVKHRVGLELQLGRRDQRVSHGLHRHVQLQHGDDLGVEANLDVARARAEHHVDELAHLPEGRLLHPALDHPRSLDVVVALERRGDDRRRDVLRGVDNLFNAGHAEGDVHGRDAREVEGFQGHLRPRLADGLRADRADGAAGLDALGAVLAHAPL